MSTAAVAACESHAARPSPDHFPPRPTPPRSMDLYSLCEHHVRPFWGRAAIAYVPNGRVLGAWEGRRGIL